MNVEDLPPKYQKQAQDKLARQSAKKAPRASKYKNVKQTVGKLKFDSKKEAQRFEELFAMERAGMISNLHLQQTFTLREAYTLPNGERVRGTTYKADFTYYDQDGAFVIEDVKSVATKENAVYKLKKKMMIDKGFMITEIC